MPKKGSLLLFVLLISLFPLKAEKYYVYLTDKDGATLDAGSYFHPNTIERRARCGVPLVQYSDLPVRKDYIEQIVALSDSVTLVSRWFNMLCVHSTLAPDKFMALPCVKRVERPLQQEAKLCMIDSVFPSYSEALKFYQTERMEASVLRSRGLDGEGVVIAIIDAGFTGMSTDPAFEHMSVLKAWDFVRDDANPYRGSTHGTQVAACMGGMDVSDSSYFGLAPKAQYLIARSERLFMERLVEEEYWLAAAEWADKNGADVINSSLGYTRRRYQVEDMDGETALISRAASMAFSKGIVVVVAAGNEGGGSWKYISAPADADSVIAVGGIDPYSDLRSSFSSYGPNAKSVPKPNVCAYGSAVVPDRLSGTTITKGTSFASPLVAGFVACMVQAFPEYNQHQLFASLQESGHLYPYFDLAHGYGIPLASKLFQENTNQGKDYFTLEETDSEVYLKVTDLFLESYPDEDRRKRLNIYAHVKNTEGKVVYYACYNDLDDEGWLMQTEQFSKGYEIMVHFEGCTKTHIIQE